MRSVSAAVQTALASGTLVPRDFLWLTVKQTSDNAPFSTGYWSGIGNYAVDVIDPAGGSAVSRTYKGIGSLVGVSPVMLTMGLQAHRVQIGVNQIEPDVMGLLRGYNVKQGRVELHRGFLDPATERLVDAAVPRFVGTIDEVEIVTPEEGGEGSATLTCVSHTQEMNRRHHTTRSDADQKRRNSQDSFFQHAATVGTWKIFWGQKSA